MKELFYNVEYYIVVDESFIIFVNRELGVSKMSSGIFGEAVFGVLRLKMSSWFRKYPQKKKQ